MSYVLPAIPASWQAALGPETEQPYFHALRRFLHHDARTHEVLPPAHDVFRALELTPLSDVRVLLLGQDPYPGAGHAHGLAFSVRPGVRTPASLRNMYRELTSDMGLDTPAHGTLTAWALQGVLLLNAVLTVRAGESNSHQGKGWERFTDALIRAVNAKDSTVVFALWGNYARKKAGLIDVTRHSIVTAAHPSPLSARNGFFGTRPFSRINDALTSAGRPPIDWRLPEPAHQ